MDLTPEDVSNALAHWLGPTGRVDVGWTTPGSRLTGYVVHPHFQGLAPKERQDWLWNGVPDLLPVDWHGLKKVFGEQATQIGIVFTYSPSEFEELFGSENDVA